jgi:hypothetical protein
MAVVPVEHAGTGWNSGKEDEGTREVMPARGARDWLGLSNRQHDPTVESAGDWLGLSNEQYDLPRRECRGLAGTLERAI